MIEKVGYANVHKQFNQELVKAIAEQKPDVAASIVRHYIQATQRVWKETGGEK
ncbi:hypothetical protein GCM10011391_09130 [Pullulanibacillus camelliae]|uniref:Uncharacterized protein n=1 Tax=Pullulanibacillus camelliae TaxID=1707096 RepID=A0A8J2VMZ7_9BACL|nr:hypothetical protein [Pullulanibacillus camelliae]GGE32641.1 hypothetical protein GCM10011391_09130 [Pullulanibacillus camelliae]